MKQLMITIVLSASTFGANARSVNENKIALHTHATRSAATIDMKGDNVVFHGLARTGTDMYIMDQSGNVELAGKVSKKHNTIDVSSLPKGSHIIALKQGADVKMFGYSSEVVVRAKK